MTAHYLIHEYRSLKPGDTVLIHAAAGGLGLLLVQWAKHLGARVIGTVSTEAKAQAARAAGADEVVLCTRQDLVAETKRLTHGLGADLIIDGVGKRAFTGNLEARPGSESRSGWWWSCSLTATRCRTKRCIGTR